MMQIYSDKPADFRKVPKKETIQLLIDFSKSLKIIKTQSNHFIELNLN
ncbi:hypothetical protein [Tenacibaculum maritimum]|nr:hypothetical protein [Tenacibaculum maritimum]